MLFEARMKYTLLSPLNEVGYMRIALLRESNLPLMLYIMLGS